MKAVIERALQQFAGVWVLDGSTLDVLLRKVGLLREGEGAVLAGRMGCLLNAASLLPEEVWFEEDSQAHDQNFWERAVARLPQGGLLLFDLGFVNYTWFDTLTKAVCFFVTRCKTNAVYQVDQVLEASAHPLSTQDQPQDTQRSKSNEYSSAERKSTSLSTRYHVNW